MNSINKIIIIIATAACANAQQRYMSANQMYLWNSEYLRLNHRIYFQTEDNEEIKRNRVTQVEEVPPIEERLREIVKEAIIACLASPRPLAPEIAKVIRDVQGELSFGPDYPPHGNIPFTDLVRIGDTDSLVAAYAMFEGNDAITDSKPFLEFYSRAGVAWNLVATAGSEFRAHSFFVDAVRSPVATERWYLVSGRRTGDSAVRLMVRLYGFDGKGVRTIWKKDEMIHGEVNISNGSIILEHQLGHADGQRVREVYSVSLEGLTQKSKENIADKQ